MGYRNGTYVAFDGLGQKNPTYSDFKYYGIIQGWAQNKNIEFKFINSHEKTYSVYDSSEYETLKSRIRERLASSKNMVLIISSNTRKKGSTLSYEIEQAVDRYTLPLIITYTDYAILAHPLGLSKLWPNALTSRIYNGKAKAVHIPFSKNAILDAINQFNVHNGALNDSLCYYSQKAHQSLGCETSSNVFKNTLK
jgi:hypothetical protein